MQNVKKEFEETYRLINDQLSRAHETTENETRERASSVSELEELKETIPNLHDTKNHLKLIRNNKSSEEDMKQLHSKTSELQKLSVSIYCVFLSIYKCIHFSDPIVFVLNRVY